jgi:hypothetical protein
MKTSAKSPKLTKARREYTCHRCRLPIARGESYRCQVDPTVVLGREPVGQTVYRNFPVVALVPEPHL